MLRQYKARPLAGGRRFVASPPVIPAGWLPPFCMSNDRFSLVVAQTAGRIAA
jgi:hypothetical protein